MKIGILDQSPISEGSTGADALRNTIDLARLADQLGYARYWLAEHHGTPMLACASPEVMIAAIGSATQTIRIGSGGVMLPHYSPLKVAETFSILSALFPNRVDLGIGRAPVPIIRPLSRCSAIAVSRLPMIFRSSSASCSLI